MLVAPMLPFGFVLSIYSVCAAAGYAGSIRGFYTLQSSSGWWYEDAKAARDARWEAGDTSGLRLQRCYVGVGNVSIIMQPL